MAAPNLSTDLFIVDIGGNNYKCTFQQLQDYVQPFVPGTAMLFYMDAAPLYWTQEPLHPEHANSIVRTVKGFGGGIGGHVPFDTVFGTHTIPMNNHTHGLSGNGNHNHSVAFPAHGHSFGTSPHDHPISGSTVHSHFWWTGNSHEGSNSNVCGCGPTANRTGTTTGATAGNTPKSATTGVSVSNSGRSFSCSAGGPGSLSVNNNRSPMNSFAFKIKYSVCIVCYKN